MNDMPRSSAGADDYIVDRCAYLEMVTCELYGLSTTDFRRLVTKNLQRMPGRSGLAELQIVEHGLVVVAVALKIRLLLDDMAAEHPDLWARCKWVSLLDA